MKKIISLLLCLAVVGTTVSLAVPTAVAAEPGRTTEPVIYLCGSGSTIIRENEDGTTEQLYPLVVPEGYIDEQVERFLPVFAEAFFTQEWDEFSDVLCEILLPIFEPMKLDKNGEASDGSHVDWSWSRETLKNTEKNGTYGVMDYVFYYDWRLSPLETAKTLRQYIEDVMYVTGEDEVSLFGRCLGSNMTAAYMKLYDGEYVKEVVHYASAVAGASFMSKIFTGELSLDADGMERFLYDMNLDIGEQLNELLRAFVTMFNDTYGMDIVTWAVNNVFKDIYLDIIPRVIVNSYGTFPAYWSMVCVEDYDKAKQTVYYGSELEEYAKLIEKTDAYHYGVQRKFPATVKRHLERGIEFSNIVKYGKQDAPVTNKGNQMSDFLVLVDDASYGATTTLIGETFSEDYLKAAKQAGTDKYISPDKTVDASTCLSPDTTWFIKDLHHYNFPDSSNELISQIVNNDGFTVFSDSAYPQYLLYNEKDGTISILNEDNMDTTPEWNTSYFTAFKKFFEIIIALIMGTVQ